MTTTIAYHTIKKDASTSGEEGGLLLQLERALNRADEVGTIHNEGAGSEPFQTNALEDEPYQSTRTLLCVKILGTGLLLFLDILKVVVYWTLLYSDLLLVVYSNGTHIYGSSVQRTCHGQTTYFQEKQGGQFATVISTSISASFNLFSISLVLIGAWIGTLADTTFTSTNQSVMDRKEMY